MNRLIVFFFQLQQFGVLDIVGDKVISDNYHFVSTGIKTDKDDDEIGNVILKEGFDKSSDYSKIDIKYWCVPGKEYSV